MSPYVCSDCGEAFELYPYMPPVVLICPACLEKHQSVEPIEGDTVEWRGNMPPYCDFCSSYTYTEPVSAQYDGKTTDGPWALMCESHFEAHGIGLGTGKGQRITYEKEPA